MIHEVEGPDGKVIKVEGPEDATDAELISVARNYYSQLKAPAAKPTTKPEAKADSEAIVPGKLPELSNPEDLSREVAATAPNAKKEETTQPQAVGSIFEPLGKGQFGEAWQNVPQTTRDLITYGTGPVLAGSLATAAGLRYLKSGPFIKPDVQGGDGIRSRTISANAPTPPAGGGAAPVATPTFNPKEAKIAADIENKYGFSWKDIKSNFGVSDVTITNPLEAQMLADSYKNQQTAAAAPAPEAPVTTAAPQAPAAPSERVTFTVQDIQSASPGQTEWKFGDRTLNAQEYADWLNQQTQPPAEAPKTPTAAAEAPKAPTAPPAEAPALQPAPPPAETPKAAVPPEKLTKEQKGMKNHLVSMYGGGPEGEAAYAKVKEILGTTPEFPKGQGGGLSPEQTKIIKDWRKANIEGPKVNLTYDMKKALKGGGGLAVLAAIPGFAEAAANKDIGKMTDIATDFLVLPFAQSREVGEGEQFELAKRRYEGMVGGGRGIAPPSPRQQVGRR